MKTASTLLCLVAATALSFAADAQDVDGRWQVESVNSAEPPAGVSLTLTFGEENQAKITYSLSREVQSWDYTYSVADGQITLEPANAFGKPRSVTYDIKFDDGKLLLLTPRLEPIQEETDEGEREAEGEADTEGETGSAADKPAEVAEGEEESGPAEETEEEAEDDAEEEEEEDNRIPVWVLTKA
ncbi:MAG: hypothetical protein AAGC72_13690 [Planctomycetota bacterium]